MTPKEKAIELVNKFKEINEDYIDKYQSKPCALIAVDEIIIEIYNISHQYTSIYDITSSSYLYNDCKELIFWKEVKQEIEKL